MEATKCPKCGSVVQIPWLSRSSEVGLETVLTTLLGGPPDHDDVLAIKGMIDSFFFSNPFDLVVRLPLDRLQNVRSLAGVVEISGKGKFACSVDVYVESKASRKIEAVRAVIRGVRAQVETGEVLREGCDPSPIEVFR